MNNNAIEVLMKLIVPAIFLIAWALNQLFNKESPASPNRSGPSLGPRSGGGLPPAPRPGPRNAEEQGRNPATLRWPKDATNDPMARAGGSQPAGSDEIIILGTETRPPRRSGPPSRGRGGRRGRPGAAPEPEREESTRKNVLNLDLPKPISQSIDLRPVMEPLVGPIMPLDPKATDTVRPVPIGTALTALDLQISVRDPARLREAILLSELLQPPVSQRRPQR